MDVCIDTSIIEEGISNLSNSIDSIVSATSDIQSCVAVAHNDFDTVNYERANDSIATATTILEQMQANLSSAKEYLARLSELIEQYDSLRY